MAATNFTPISLYYSATAAAVPSAGNLVAGELALNTLDEKLYFKNLAGTVKLLASNSGSAGSVTSVAMTVPSVLSISGSPITSSGTLALTYSGTALPVANGGTGITSFGTGVATWLGTPSSANLAAAVTDETGSGALVFATSPTLVTPALGSPSSVGTMPAFTLGGTVSGGGNQINNVVIGTTTPLAGAFTTLSATGTLTSTKDGLLLERAGASNASQYIAVGNTSGQFYFGANGSVANSFFTGGTAFDTNLGVTGGFAIGMNGGAQVARFSSTALALQSGISLTGGTSGTGYSFSGSAPANSLTLTSVGDVGIGTATPTLSGAKLVVIPANTTGSSAYLTFDCTNLVDSNFQILITGTASTDKRAVIGTTTNTSLALVTNNTERARFNTTGALVFAGGTTTADGIGITFPATQSASTNANTLDDYDEYTATSAACTGAITTAAVWKLTKVGNVVTLTLPAVTGTAAAAANFTFGTVIPAKYRPVASVKNALASVQDNGAILAAPGMCYINSATGSINIYMTLVGATNFTAAAVAGLETADSVSWTI